jgi:hypothetical protein
MVFEGLFNSLLASSIFHWFFHAKDVQPQVSFPVQFLSSLAVGWLGAAFYVALTARSSKSWTDAWLDHALHATVAGSWATAASEWWLPSHSIFYKILIMGLFLGIVLAIPYYGKSFMHSQHE